jgi:chorismate mutase/prephenate dehydratase
MDCSGQVAEYKAAHDMPVLNEQREKEILSRVREDCDAFRSGYGNAAALVFATMMDASRALQHKKLGAGIELREMILNAKRELLKPVSARIACQGVPGAYSDEAAARLFPGAKPQFYETFADVFEAVKEEKADYGILPVENSSAGSVNEVYDLVMKHRFTIAAAAELPINHSLLALHGAVPEDLKKVYSHPQGLAQCADFIAARHLEACSYVNTAAAARMVAESGDKSLCAIASRTAANIYGLDVIEENIQSVENNSTRFFAISRGLVIPPDANKISLIFALPHVTGSLYRTLSRFAMAGLNLTKLESRPVRNGGFEYLFYLDFEGGLNNPETVDLLCALSEEMPSFSFIGNYRELD